MSFSSSGIVSSSFILKGIPFSLLSLIIQILRYAGSESPIVSRICEDLSFSSFSILNCINVFAMLSSISSIEILCLRAMKLFVSYRIYWLTFMRTGICLYPQPIYSGAGGINTRGQLCKAGLLGSSLLCNCYRC